MKDHLENWDDYRIFIAIIETGSLQKAGQVLHVAHTTVLRRLNSLEERLMVRLFERLRSGYIPTSAGEKLYQNLRPMQDTIMQAQRQIAGEDIKLSGTIKISTTDTIGYYWLPPYLRDFHLIYPNIHIEMDINNQYTDMSKREADIVIPALNKQPDTMVGRELCPINFKLFAHKEYMERKHISGPIREDELAQHEIILPTEPLASNRFFNYLRSHSTEEKIIASSNKITGLLAFCRQSMGIAPLPSYIHSYEPDLREIMPIPPSIQHNMMWILTHPDLRNTARIKAFMEFMRSSTSRQ